MKARFLSFGALALMLALAGCGDTGLSNKRADQEGETVVGQSLARGKDYVCMQNIRQVRSAIVLFQSNDPDGAAPTDLSQLRLPSEMTQCAVGKEPYKFDAAAVTVKCEHPGHKKY